MAHPWLTLGSPLAHTWLALGSHCSLGSLFAHSWLTWFTWLTWLILLILGLLGSSQPYTEDLLSALAQRRSYQPW